MNALLTKAWSGIVSFVQKWWLLLIAAGILLFLAFRGCNNLPSHNNDKKALDSLMTVYAAEKKADQLIIDSLQQHDLRTSQERDSLISEIFDAQEDLSERGKIVRSNLAAGDTARAKKDTAAIVQNADELRVIVAAGVPAVQGYERLTDSLISTCLTSGRVKDSIANTYKRLAERADSVVAFQQQKYNALSSDYRKANLRLKFNKTVSRVEAAALLATLIKIFVIKN
ncbi:MAG TPA: hypothetical protein VGM31_14195 [Puia sp.]|jgi:hypothetical protein